jgi:hypothetical protein
VKVVDFDIAKGSTEGEASDLTQLGLVIGTPEYMSPEQMTADKLDGRSDVYSLAMVLFRMLAGVLPFSARTTREVMLQRLTAKPGTLAAAVPEATFPEGLQEVLDQGLARDPERRFPDAEAFARALAPFGPGARAGAARASADATRPPGATASFGSAQPPERTTTEAPSPPSEGRPRLPEDRQPEPGLRRGQTAMPATQVTKSSSRSPLLVVVPVVLIVLGVGVIWALTRGGGGGVAATELVVTPESATIARGETVQLAMPPELELSSGPVDWSSSDLAVASVDPSGLVTGVAPGTASITASAGDRSVAARVSVSSDAVADVPPPTEPASPSRLVLGTSMLAFESAEGAPPPEARSLSVEGTRVSTLESRVRYEHGQPADWLVAGLSGSAPPATLTISVRSGGLAVGSYSATVEVSSAEGVGGPVRVTYVKRAADAAAGGGGADNPVTEPAAWAVADTFALLDEINDRISDGLSGAQLAAAGDTARMIWNTEGARPAVSAAAAFTLAQVELTAGNAQAALEWAERAAELAPENDGYRRLRDALRGVRW